LDQPPGTVDAQPDAIAGHAELQFTGDTRAEIASVCSCRDQQHVRTPLLEHLAQRRRPHLGVVVVELSVHDAVGPVSRELVRCVRPEDERDVVAAELAGELPPFRQQLK